MMQHNNQQTKDAFTNKVASYFDDLAPSWSRNYSPQGSMLARIDRFAEALKSAGVSKGSKVLDFGCGAGTISYALESLGYHVTGVDISPHMIEVAQQGDSSKHIQWHILDGSRAELPFLDATFDAVIASSVLEYVPEPVQLITEFQRILVSDGILACTVPDERHQIRQSESARLKRMQKPFFRTLINLLPVFLPVRRRYDYLSLSVTRWSPSQWQSAFLNAGFHTQPAEECQDPLMLFIASKDSLSV